MKTWVLAGIVLIVGCAAPRRSLTILHTNDIHGHFVSERASWRSDSAMVGGFGALSGALDSVRNADKNTIYLDAGDLMTGNPICNMDVDETEGGALLHLLNLCECDAIALGNHEFDLGPEHLRGFVSTDKVNWLSANTVDNSTDSALCPSYKIIERGGVRIGVIGLILTDLAGVVSKPAITDFTITDIAKSAQKAIDEIDGKTDLIILLTHNGVDKDKELAGAVHGCDIIVGGHSHTRLSDPVFENNVIIVQAGSYLKNLGVLNVDIQKDKVTRYKGQLVELDVARFAADPDVVDYCKRFSNEIDREYGEVIATAGAPWERSYVESSTLGNLLCDLLLDGYKTDFALINSGGIRKDVMAGPVRKLDIVEMLPFANFVNTFEVSGAELLTLAAKQVKSQISGKSEVLQMSGIEIAYESDDDVPKNVQVLVNGVQADSSATYRGVSIDYVLKSQAEKYLGFKPRETEETGVLLSDYIINALSAASQPIYPKNEKRLIREGK
ncbi:MAG: bifunctional metallophosphatase/5'-nucleotidase [bacterium]|nr:bifunctional metallophosphatase/5'-nucleotidase [bacterium]